MINHSDNRKAFYGFPIPNEWRLEKLGIFGDTYTGLSGKAKEDFGVGKPYIPYLNIFNNAIIRDGDFGYVNIEIEENQNLVQNGDLFFTTSSETPEEVGMCSVYLGNEPELYLNSFCFGFRTYNKTEVSTEYLAQLFRSLLGRRIIYKLAQGATRYNISKTNLLNEEIPLPPLPEQKAIARVLSTADATILTTEKLIAQKELRKKWLMQQLLTGKMRLKGFGGEWKEKKLSEVFERVTRKNTEGNTTVVTISAQRGFVRQTDFFKKNIASEITDNYFLVEKGEFCYNKSYSNGYPWGATKRLIDFDKAVVTTLYICFGVKDEKKNNPEFFEQYFNANLLDKGLTKIAHEGGRAHGLLNVTPSDFFSLKATVPTYEEQTEIAQVLQAADKEIQLLKAKAEKLREQKKGLMQVLLTGKVRLKINNNKTQKI